MDAERESRPILIVEDDEPTQNVLQVVFRRGGHESVVASNGREAIRLLQENDYAVVVLDIMMPSVGGREVIAFLEGLPNPAPVIICTAVGPSALQGIRSPIVKAVVRKPFDIDDIIEAVNRVIGRAGA